MPPYHAPPLPRSCWSAAKNCSFRPAICRTPPASPAAAPFAFACARWRLRDARRPAVFMKRRHAPVPSQRCHAPSCRQRSNAARTSSMSIYCCAARVLMLEAARAQHTAHAAPIAVTVEHRQREMSRSAAAAFRRRAATRRLCHRRLPTPPSAEMMLSERRHAFHAVHVATTPPPHVIKRQRTAARAAFAEKAPEAFNEVMGGSASWKLRERARRVLQNRQIRPATRATTRPPPPLLRGYSASGSLFAAIRPPAA